jgi:hypothetical protein
MRTATGQAAPGARRRKLPIAELAQDHQALLVAERAQEAGGLAGAGFEVCKRECLQVHHCVHITVLANLASPNI